jgi:hypothetical protein
VSQTATIGNVSSPGYWLQYNNGDARFGGNVSIGANLNVAGLITTGSLNSNTVATTTMVPAAVSVGISMQSSTDTVFTNPSPLTNYFDTSNLLQLTTVENNQSVYLFGQIKTESILNVTSTVTSLIISTGLYRINPGGSLTLVKGYNNPVTSPSAPGLYRSTIGNEYVGYLDTPPTPGLYGYVYAVAWGFSGGSMTMNEIAITERNLLIQSLKR